MGRSTEYQRYWRRTLIQLHGGICQWCEHEGRPVAVAFLKGMKGKDEPCCKETDPDILQFAHVHGKETAISNVPRGRGSWHRMVDVFNHPDSYVLLCKDHHREYDKSK